MRSRILRLAAIALLVGLPPAVRPEQAVACSCAGPPPTIEEFLEEARSVFVGTVAREREFGDEYRTTVVTEFRVSTVWKGPALETIYLTHRPGPCQGGYTEGVEYLVYVPSGWRAPGYCDRDMSLGRAQRDLAILGDGQPPEPGTSNGIPFALREAWLSEDSPLLPAWGIGLLVAGALFLAGAGFRVARRRARQT